MPDFLSCTERGGAQPIVTRYVGGFSRTVRSSGFGTLIATEPSADHIQLNAVIQTDANTLWCVLWDGLYRSTDGGLTFSSVFAFASAPANDNTKIAHSGLHYIYDAGGQETFLAGFHANAAGALVGWRYRLSDGATAEVTGPTPAAAALVSEILYGSVIHLAYGNASSPGFYSFDPIGGSWATYAHSPSAAHGNAFTVAPDGLIYAVSYDNSSLIRVHRFTGTWNYVGSIETIVTASGTSGSRFGMFSDGTDIFAIYLVSGGGGYGWRVKRIPSPFDLTGASDIGTTVLPAVLRNGTDGGTADGNATKRCLVIQDTESTPGTLRTFLCFSNDNVVGTPWQVYEWGGPGSAMTFVGSGGAVRDSLPSASRGGGGYFFTPGQAGVRILSVTPVSGGESISFVASGGGTVDVQFRRSSSAQAPTAIATLIGTATGGGTRVSNQVQGVTADGITVNTITWDFFTDGFSNGQPNVVLVPETV